MKAQKLPFPWKCLSCCQVMTLTEAARHEQAHRAAAARASRSEKLRLAVSHAAVIAARHIKRDNWGRAIECENPLCRAPLARLEGSGRPPCFCSATCRLTVRRASLRVAIVEARAAREGAGHA